MSGFITIAGLLTLLVLVALLYPLLRRRGDSPEAWRSAGILGLLILVGAAALYPLWSEYKWNEPMPAADSPEAMVGRLARRLERNPDDLEGWLMLGRSYSVLAEQAQRPAIYELAARAYQRADNLAKGTNAEALVGLAEALVLSEKSDLAGRAGRLFEQAMQLEGAPVKALFYSAVAARERNELSLAKQRFEEMLVRANPPPDVAQIIQQQIQQIDALSAMAAGAPGAAAVAGSPAATQGAEVVTIPLRITLAQAVADKAVAGAPLFVAARIPGQRIPVATKRLEARFPQDIELLSTEGMAGTGAAFMAGQELEIQAHVSSSAISRTGDPFGTVRVKAGSSQRAAIEINQLRP